MPISLYVLLVLLVFAIDFHRKLHTIILACVLIAFHAKRIYNKALMFPAKTTCSTLTRNLLQKNEIDCISLLKFISQNTLT